MHLELIIIGSLLVAGIFLAVFLFKQSQHHKYESMMRDLADSIKENLVNSREQILNVLHQGQLHSVNQIQDQLTKGITETRQQLQEKLNQNTELLSKQMDKLILMTEGKLKEISGQVEKRLTEGFEKTTATFTDVLKRLALIDEAQKKITELSSNVISLQEILADKRSRGAFGEVQLNALIRNYMPENHFSLQHTLSNDKRADCILFLPEPTGNVVVDSKFPLENYYRLIDTTLGESDHLKAEQQFKLDIRKHIQDIAEKYIIPGETADGAMMFIPAEAIFSEIHSHYPDLVEIAQRARVWMVSPTTLMAILTTARAVLKDAATRKQIHIIQEHLHYLAKDFSRFEKRMGSLAKHIHQVHDDVNDVTTSAKKITSRFEKIEKVELEGAEPLVSLPEEVTED
ncbi:MAG: DNA recombination protein RmuC [Proteobacteria bacterium]|nr:DNA recombination protein RmuC [Pseudomonadota bacterium]